jgi:hypothetical protein
MTNSTQASSRSPSCPEKENPFLRQPAARMVPLVKSKKLIKAFLKYLGNRYVKNYCDDARHFAVHRKIMHVFFNMDKMIGSDFETGLLNLKAATEQ